MNEKEFSLIPFADTQLPEIRIQGRISRKGNDLTIHYDLTGELDNLALPLPSTEPIRKDELWKSTCLEFFIALPDRPEYWEFNLSPSGDWNIYHMDAYRRVGFREETLFQRLPFSVQKEVDRISIVTAINLGPIIQKDTAIQVGITGIIQSTEGHETYWALTHPNPQADFHLRESFIIRL